MKEKSIFIVLLYLSACSTLDQSLELGASLGAATGMAATYAGYSAGNKSPSLETAALGAGLGVALGLLTSYFTHDRVMKDRKEDEASETEMHFGDLPESPFVVPRAQIKRGGR